MVRVRFNCDNETSTVLEIDDGTEVNSLQKIIADNGVMGEDGPFTVLYNGSKINYSDAVSLSSLKRAKNKTLISTPPRPGVRYKLLKEDPRTLYKAASSYLRELAKHLDFESVSSMLLKMLIVYSIFYEHLGILQMTLMFLAYIVVQRLPVSAKLQNDGSWVLSKSAGGLIAALEGVSNSEDTTWLGWIGADIGTEQQASLSKSLAEKYNAFPVFLPENLARQYYNGFSNSILWPLLHYLPGEIHFDESSWESYVEVNKLFLTALVSLTPGQNDIVWIHDYHLMILPYLVRNHFGSKVKIGFFLHTPFPSSEIFTVLPVASHLLTCMIQSNLVAFHSLDYVRHFNMACKSIKDTQKNSEVLSCKVIALPIGIDVEKFSMSEHDSEVLGKLQGLEIAMRGKRVILGVDRLDYIKGLPNKIVAYIRFLEKYAEYREDTVFIQIAVPSREDVEEYAELKKLIFELTGKANGTFGSSEHTPLHLIHHSVDFPELASLYQRADVCIITSLRDGMNLVSYEYIASQVNNHGVLILSEFTGASQSFSGALHVNPWDADNTADAIQYALQMEVDERNRRHSEMLHYIKNHSAKYWANYFLTELEECENETSEGNLSANDSFSIVEYEDQMDASKAEVSARSGLLLVNEISQKLFASSVDMVAMYSLQDRTFKAAGSDIWVDLVEVADSTKDDVVSLLRNFRKRLPGTELTISECFFECINIFGDHEIWEILSEEVLKCILAIHEEVVILKRPNGFKVCVPKSGSEIEFAFLKAVGVALNDNMLYIGSNHHIDFIKNSLKDLYNLENLNWCPI